MTERTLYLEADIERSFAARILSRPPSPEISALAGLDASIFQEANNTPSHLCAATPANMVGSLVVELEKERYQRIYRALESDVPRAIRQPVELIRDIPVRLGSLEFMAGDVLLKRASGEHNAVVLTGPLAGLILERSEGSGHYTDGMTASRVWNDSRLVTIDPELPLPFAHLLALRPHYLDREEARFRAILEEVLDRGNWSVEAFFHLCGLVLPREVSGKMDTGEFHYTRDPAEV